MNLKTLGDVLDTNPHTNFQKLSIQHFLSLTFNCIFYRTHDNSYKRQNLISKSLCTINLSTHSYQTQKTQLGEEWGDKPRTIDKQIKLFILANLLWNLFLWRVAVGRHEINSCKYMCIYLELFWLCFYNVFEVVIYLSPLFIYRRFFYNFFFILTFVRLRLTFYLYKNISTVQKFTNLKIIDFISFKPFETPLCYELWAYMYK